MTKRDSEKADQRGGDNRSPSSDAGSDGATGGEPVPPYKDAPPARRTLPYSMIAEVVGAPAAQAPAAPINPVGASDSGTGEHDPYRLAPLPYSASFQLQLRASGLPLVPTEEFSREGPPSRLNSPRVTQQASQDLGRPDVRADSSETGGTVHEATTARLPRATSVLEPTQPSIARKHQKRRAIGLAVGAAAVVTAVVIAIAASTSGGAERKPRDSSVSVTATERAQQAAPLSAPANTGSLPVTASSAPDVSGAPIIPPTGAGSEQAALPRHALPHGGEQRKATRPSPTGRAPSSVKRQPLPSQAGGTPAPADPPSSKPTDPLIKRNRPF